MLTFHRRALAVFVLVTLCPNLAWSQPEKVGIVTTLVGNVTARRVILPESVPLKFKDDVFYEDTITTGAQSLARVLLGGKSIVTIRERSVLTSTESPGRSFVNLESGKIGLAVARDRLAPGESVDIRTPNAVVGVRGTVVVTEVLPGASNIYFLRGSGECSVLDPRTRRPIGAPVIVKPFEAFKVVGSTMRIDPIPPSQVGQITAGLDVKGYQHIEAGNKEQVKKQVTDATAAVVGALASGAAVGLDSEGRIVMGTDLRVVVPDVNGPSNFPPNITIDPALIPFVAGRAAAPTPVVTVPGGIGALTIPGNAFEVQARIATPSDLDRPLFQVINGNLNIGGNVLNVLGSLSSTSALPVLSTDPTTITTGSDFVRIASGASVSLTGPLVSDTDGMFNISGRMLAVDGGGSLTSTGATPVLQFNKTNVTVTGDFVGVGNGARLMMTGSSDPLVTVASAAKLAVGNALLSGSNATITGSTPTLVNLAGGSSITAGSVLDLTSTSLDLGASWTVLHLSGGSRVATTPASAIRISGGSLTADVLARTDGLANVLTLTGPVLDITNTSVRLQRINETPAGSTDVFALTLGLNMPVIRMSGSTLTTTGVDADLVAVGGGVKTTGTALTATGSSMVNVKGSLLRLADVTSLPTDPLVQLAASTVNQTATAKALIDVSGTTALTRQLLALDNSTVTATGNVLTVRGSLSDVPSRMTLTGPLFVATNNSGVSSASGFVIDQGAALTGTSPRDLIRLVTSTFTAGPAASANFFEVASDPLSATRSAVSIAGRLLSTDSSTVTAPFSLLAVVRSSFTSTTRNALIEAVNSVLAFGRDATQPGGQTLGRMLTVTASPTVPATVALSGPLALLTGSNVTATEMLVGVFGGVVSSMPGTGAELIQLTNSTVRLGSSTPGQEIFGRALFITGEGGPGGVASLTVNGPLLSSLNGALTVTGRLVEILPGAQLTANGTGDAPLVSITGGTHSIGTFSNSSIFFMQGRPTATTEETADGIEITHGTDQPITTGRTLLGTSGATITSEAGAVFDTMLFQATAPIFSASLGSSLTFANDAILFSKNVKMTTAAPVVALNASALTSMNGAILNLNGSSLLQASGDLFSLSNGSLLRTLNGPLIRVANGSVLNVAGALAAFFGSGNVINVTNSLCASGCLTFPGGITVAFSGTPPGNVSIGSNPFRNPSSGSLVKSPNAAVIVIQGNSKVTIAGTP